jgi:hypothetical protein
LSQPQTYIAGTCHTPALKIFSMTRPNWLGTTPPLGLALFP